MHLLTIITSSLHGLSIMAFQKQKKFWKVADRSVNQPLGRNHAFVCVGPGGIRNHDARPTPKVMQPSIRNRYRQPDFPFTPLKRKIPVAKKALNISVI